jgi:predicted MPP superfamily phosphohydrolase
MGMRRLLAALAFLSLILTVLVGGHLYLAQRLVLDLALPGPLRNGLLAGIGGLAATLLLQPIGERTLRPPWSRVLAWPASLWMGFAFLLLVATALSGLLLALLGVAGPGVDGVLAARLRAAVVAVAAAGAGVVGVRSALRPPALRRVELQLARWPRALDGFRIAQISDLHIGPILGRRFAAEVVRRVNDLGADLVAVTGDLVDGSVAKLREEVAPFKGLRGRLGVFFVIGNHDMYSGTEAWAAHARELGMRVLRNERVTLEDGGARFDLAGVDDHHAHLVSGTHREDLPRALAGRDPALPVILLAHDPGTFRRASELGVDLQLSGHTHGGQLWPFGHVVRLAVPFVAGRFERSGSVLYVSRGTGFWGPPMRLLAPSEITEIVLRSGAGAS